MKFFNKIFSSNKNTRTAKIFAPLSGRLLPIEEVPDTVFREKIVGDGVAIEPIGNKMVAPVDGVIGKIFVTNHAFSIKSSNGIELFVHFGFNTVDLKGEGFDRVATEGHPVKIGDPIITFNLELLKKKATSIITPVVISNVEEVKEIVKLSGNVIEGKTPIMHVKLKEKHLLF